MAVEHETADVTHELPDSDTTAATVYRICGAAVEQHGLDELPALLAREDGFVWVDIEACDERATRLLLDVFAFHPLAVRDCLERTPVPKIHAYPNHMFVVLHAPEPGDGGRVHLLEIDQFIGRQYLVTVHEPGEDEARTEAGMRETRAVLERMRGGRVQPASPVELSYLIVSALARRMEAFVWTLAGKVGALERLVIEGDERNTEKTLEEMFRVRHELLTLRTAASQNREMYARMTALARFLPPESHAFIQDVLDQFDRVRSLADSQRELLQGVLDFYQTRTATKMNIAMERLALMTAVVLPITALASIYGMNIIVNEHTQGVELAAVIVAMVAITVLMLRWAKHQGWW